MYYPEAVSKLHLSKNLQAESELKGQKPSVLPFPNFNPESWDGMLLKHSKRRFVD